MTEATDFFQKQNIVIKRLIYKINQNIKSTDEQISLFQKFVIKFSKTAKINSTKNSINSEYLQMIIELIFNQNITKSEVSDMGNRSNLVEFSTSTIIQDILKKILFFS